MAPTRACGPASMSKIRMVRSGLCSSVEFGADRDAEVAVVLVELFERPHHFRGASRLRSAAEALGQRVAQPPLGQARGCRETPSDRPRAPRRGCSGARRRRRRASTASTWTSWKRAEAVEVSDGRAHGRHRQRLPDARLDEIDERGIGASARLRRARAPGRPVCPRTIRAAAARRRAAASSDDERHEQEQPDAHQKLRRTRKSIANVRSPVCVSTKPRRSVWSYSSTMI